MPHPSQSDRFLTTAKRLLKTKGWIHYYRHVSGADVEEARTSLGWSCEGCGEGVVFKSRRVRETGPHYLESRGHSVHGLVGGAPCVGEELGHPYWLRRPSLKSERLDHPQGVRFRD